MSKLFNRHFIVPKSAIAVTNNMYHLLRKSKNPIKLIHDSVQSSLKLLQSLPVRQSDLLQSLNQIRLYAEKNAALNVIENDENWKALSHDLQIHTTNFTSKLLLQQYSPATVDTKYTQSIREIFWHAHSSHLSIETLLSIGDSSVNANHDISQISLEFAIRNIMESANALSIEKYGVVPPIVLDLVVMPCENDDDDNDNDTTSYQSMTVVELRNALGLDEQTSKAKSAKGTSKEYFKKSKLIEMTEESAMKNVSPKFEDICVNIQEIYYIEYCMVELIKNSFGAMIEKYGALEVEDEKPIKLIMKAHPQNGFAGLTLLDNGIGMSQYDVEHSCEPLFTSAKEEQDDPWRYSRTFGARFAGAGLGLFKTHCYMDFLGAKNLIIMSDNNIGTMIDVKF
jgi:hypothetical protein